MADEYLAGIMAKQPPSIPTPVRWRHKKRGSTYTEIGRGLMQTDWWLNGDGENGGHSVDMADVVVYRCEEDGLIWVRPVAEFEDGRFERI